jgi:hypothetical protein
MLFDEDHPPRDDEARALLGDCTDQFVDRIVIAVRGSLDATDDLFETLRDIPDTDVERFRSGRGEWLQRFTRTLRELVGRRLGGSRRKGCRPDVDVSVATLRVLSAYDQEMQAAIVRAAQALAASARQELHALDLRVGLLLAEKAWVEPDNPFGTAYILDAIGATSRNIYPNPRLWRPLMERLLGDIRPAAVKTYIALNRYLADHGVMPEIKAALRARSELRPADDRELLPLFERMLGEVQTSAAAERAAIDIAVPPVGEIAGENPPLVFSEGPPPGGETPATTPPSPLPSLLPSPAPDVAQALYAAFARFVQRGASDVSTAGSSVRTRAGPAAESDAHAFPQLDSMMALGQSSDMIAELDQWQHFDPEREQDTARLYGARCDAAAVPLNRLPLIRNAMADRIVNPADRMTLDVVALIFDYIFRDPSIPDAQRRIFARLQVPIAKAALLDRSFFSNRQHPARRLLDHLALAAVGDHGSPGYQQQFTILAQDIVDTIAADFRIDIDTFEIADARILPFVLREQTATASALRDDIGAALSVEQADGDRTWVRTLLRDRLAGLEIPFEIRSFTETLWSDHLAAIRSAEGMDSNAWETAIATLDDLLWSITAKERTAQKARLTRLIPTLVRRLRAGVGAVHAAGERVGDFFDALYRLHIAVLRPDDQGDERAPAIGGSLGKAPPPAPAASGAASKVERQAFDPATVHDYVSEMPVGTWLRFDTAEGELQARLFWVSPMRTRYIFTTRGRGKALSRTPEELAWQLGAGMAGLVVEPVPMFDRAVSAALDTLAASMPAARRAA